MNNRDVIHCYVRYSDGTFREFDTNGFELMLGNLKLQRIAIGSDIVEFRYVIEGYQLPVKNLFEV